MCLADAHRSNPRSKGCMEPFIMTVAAGVEGMKQSCIVVNVWTKPLLRSHNSGGVLSLRTLPRTS